MSWRPEWPSSPFQWRPKLPERAFLDRDAEFYSRALHIAVSIRRPLVAAYHVAIVSLVAMAIVTLVWLCGQALDRSLPVHGVRAELVTPDVPVGERVKVHYDLVRDRVCAVDITASIIDGADVPWPLVTLHRDVTGPPGPDHFTRSWQVPLEAAPGPARLRVGWAYACPGNYLEALSPLPLAFPDMPFTIAP